MFAAVQENAQLLCNGPNQPSPLIYLAGRYCAAHGFETTPE